MKYQNKLIKENYANVLNPEGMTPENIQAWFKYVGHPSRFVMNNDCVWKACLCSRRGNSCTGS